MFLILLIPIGFLAYKIITYYNSTYHKSTHKSYLKMYSDLGSYGEYLIYKRLKSEEKTGGKFLFNTYLTKKDGTTTEIDVMLINSDGIFVFESKNYSGWIFGSENQKTWTQCLPRGKRKSQKQHFLNPIMQNNLHINTLSDYVDGNIPMYSIIVFSNRCTFKNISCKNPLVAIVKRGILFSVLNQFGAKSKNILSNEKVKELYESLFPNSQVSDEVKQKHIANIKNNLAYSENSIIANKISEQSNAIENSVEVFCPKCGGKLVLRSAKKGRNQGNDFYGCSNFPKCRYIMKS